MLELFRKYVDSLTGVTEMSRERADKLVRDLQKRGEIRARDLSKATQELVDRSVRNRRELIRLIRKEIRQQINSLGLATQDDIERLSKRVKTLESQKRSTSRPAAKKTAAKRKSSPKKTT
jgi:polyhydroxyalkanoate synthesis regulator phasin